MRSENEKGKSAHNWADDVPLIVSDEDVIFGRRVGDIRAQFTWESYDPFEDEMPKLRLRRRSVELGGLIARTAALIAPERQDWLWPYRIPLGALSLLAGAGDVGKSTLLLNIAGTISTGGIWPNGEGSAPKGSVLILSREDDPAKTIVPRLMAAGADLSKIHLIEGVREQPNRRAKQAKGQRAFNYKDDLNKLDNATRQLGDVRLVIFDPLSSYFDEGRNVWQEAQVRAVLEPLAQASATWNVSVTGNCHLSKAAGQPGSNANMKILNSVGIANLARVINMVARDKEDDELRIFGQTKKNISKPRPNLEFRFDTAFVTDQRIETAKLVWQGESEADLSELITGEARGGGKRRDFAAMWLKTYLRDGPKLADDVMVAGQEAGHSERTLIRAKESLGLRPYKEKGGQGRWWWPQVGPEADDPILSAAGQEMVREARRRMQGQE